MEQILFAASIIGSIVCGATQMIKKTTINNKFLPFLNVLIGIIIGLGWALSFDQSELIVYVWAGGLAGMAAGGFYDLKANGVALNNEKKAKKLIDNGEGLQDNREEGE
ncbi:holin [Vagococcus carniphilus]|uniref:holin n=1 Tax=Vagococcus carniphilus TaxID=218144 RepID=UPI0028928416|nr:holin [Vagococcus carniphilus]MDT2848752.1 holin [Vagococcus carniphilus]